MRCSCVGISLFGFGCFFIVYVVVVSWCGCFLWWIVGCVCGRMLCFICGGLVVIVFVGVWWCDRLDVFGVMLGMVFRLFLYCFWLVFGLLLRCVVCVCCGMWFVCFSVDCIGCCGRSVVFLWLGCVRCYCCWFVLLVKCFWRCLVVCGCGGLGGWWCWSLCCSFFLVFRIVWCYCWCWLFVYGCWWLLF